MSRLLWLLVGLVIGAAGTSLAQSHLDVSRTSPRNPGITFNREGKRLKIGCPGPSCKEVDAGSSAGRLILSLESERASLREGLESTTTWLRDQNMRLLSIARKLDGSYRDPASIKTEADRMEARIMAISKSVDRNENCSK